MHYDYATARIHALDSQVHRTFTLACTVPVTFSGIRIHVQLGNKLKVSHVRFAATSFKPRQTTLFFPSSFFVYTVVCIPLIPIVLPSRIPLLIWVFGRIVRRTSSMSMCIKHAIASLFLPLSPLFLLTLYLIIFFFVQFLSFSFWF